MMKSFMIVATVICITANMATAKPLTPDYSSLEQGGMAQTETKQNGVRELFNGQRQLVVKLLQRPLSIPGGDVAQKATGGTAAHVQIVAIDTATGEVVDNFGVTGSFDGKNKAKVFSETNLDKYNMKKPCGIYEMSMKDYYAARTRSIAQITGGAVYEPYNGVGLMNHVVEGFVGGFVDGDSKDATAGNSIINGVAGAIEGVADATHIYDESQRHNFGVHSDDEKKMSFPIINCQAGGDIFVKNLEGLPTVVPVKEYIQPGETVRELSDEKTDHSDSRQFDITSVDIDTSRIEALLNERIAFLKMLLARGERATRTEVASQNSQKQAMLQELANIVKTIEALPMPDEEKMRLAEKELAAANKLATQMTSLEGQAVARKLVSLESSNGAVYDTASCMCANPSIEIKPVASSSIPAGVFCKKCGKVVGIAQNGKITRLNHQPKER